jgi:hypothetical protein
MREQREEVLGRHAGSRGGVIGGGAHTHSWALPQAPLVHARTATTHTGASRPGASMPTRQHTITRAQTQKLMHLQQRNTSPLPPDWLAACSAPPDGPSLLPSAPAGVPAGTPPGPNSNSASVSHTWYSSCCPADRDTWRTTQRSTKGGRGGRHGGERGVKQSRGQGGVGAGRRGWGGGGRQAVSAFPPRRCTCTRPLAVPRECGSCPPGT